MIILYMLYERYERKHLNGIGMLLMSGMLIGNSVVYDVSLCAVGCDVGVFACFHG